MADTKQKLPPIPTKSKRAAKNAAAEDPFATARVRAIIDPEQADLVTAKLDEIQTASGATVTIAAAAEGTIERIISVGGSPEVVGKVLQQKRSTLCFSANSTCRDVSLF